jgi:predicted enzyme related to lactoylglutathione lyase
VLRTERRLAMEGNVLFMEFPSGDIERAQRFWSGVLGWRFGSGLAESFDYRMAPVGPDSAVAITPGDEPGHPNVYMETSDLDAALARVRELGGQAGDIREVPARLTAEIPSAAIHGRFATCEDSEGNTFHLLQRNPQ